MHVVPVPVEPPRGPLPHAHRARPAGRVHVPLRVRLLERRAEEPGGGRTGVRRGVPARRGPDPRPQEHPRTDWRPEQFAEVAALADGRADVLLRDGYVSEDDRDSYVAACDCYVSLHRSEGLGLTLAEAMASGKPVIATGYSGNLEFMREHESLLVPFRPRRRPGELVGPCARRGVGRTGRRCSRTPHATRLGAARGGARHRPCGTRRDRRALPAAANGRLHRRPAGGRADEWGAERTDVAPRPATGDPGRVAVARRGGNRRPARGRPTRATYRGRPPAPPARSVALPRGPAALRARGPRRPAGASSLGRRPGAASRQARVASRTRRTARARDRAAQLSAKRVASSSSPSAPEYS